MVDNPKKKKKKNLTTLKKPWTSYIKIPLLLQNLSSKQIRIHLNNLLLDPRLWEKFSSFHPNNWEKIKKIIFTKMFLSTSLPWFP